MHAADSVLLRRVQTVYVDPVPAGGAGPGPALRRLETELLGRGYLLSPQLHDALAGLPAEELAAAHVRLVGLADELLGSHRTHRPLLRRFPQAVPRDTEALYVDRVFAHLLQRPGQPCVLCGEAKLVRALSPCAHLVCRLCWDASAYDGCPICHRRVDTGEPFLRAVRAVGAAAPATEGPLRLMRLGTDRAADATALVGDLLARRTPLSPQDRADLLTLLPLSPAGRGLLPAEIPVRETKALVVATLLADVPEGAEAVVRALPGERLTTATDVLRVLAVLSGGDPGLAPLPRFGGLPRRLRRELLAVLDALPVPFLVEDVLRHPTAWKRAAESLHPFEGHARHPRAALAFAVLRATPVSPATALGAALLETAAGHPDAVRVDHGTGRIRPATWAGRLEQALAARDLGTATGIAAQRPGELVRRLDHLLRLAAA
ncbi:RING finger family 4 domain-containing protein, partial [Streptomyces antimicrobicus]